MWRGNLDRKYVRQLRQHNPLALSNYFSKDEEKETLDGGNMKQISDVINHNQESIEKKIYRFKTGATYHGDWLGGFRQGVGE